MCTSYQSPVGGWVAMVMMPLVCVDMPRSVPPNPGSVLHIFVFLFMKKLKQIHEML